MPPPAGRHADPFSRVGNPLPTSLHAGVDPVTIALWMGHESPRSTQPYIHADLKLKENAPDLAVIDWMLPGLSGIELIRRLRARPETQSLPIIMLTARGEETERVRGLATGAESGDCCADVMHPAWGGRG